MNSGEETEIIVDKRGEWPDDDEIDHCLDEELADLKKKGITIHFFDCDGKGDRFIVTSNRDTLKMKELDYRINGKTFSMDNKDKIYNSYEPKSICTFAEDHDDFDYDDDDGDDLGEK